MYMSSIITREGVRENFFIPLYQFCESTYFKLVMKEKHLNKNRNMSKYKSEAFFNNYAIQLGGKQSECRGENAI